jgi:hypothetical protein
MERLFHNFFKTKKVTKGGHGGKRETKDFQIREQARPELAISEEVSWIIS